MSRRFKGFIIGVLATVLTFGGISVGCVGMRNTPVSYPDEEVVVDSPEIVTEDTTDNPAESDEPSNTVDIDTEPESEIDAGADSIRIALITMDSTDQHWVTLNEGAQKAANELGVTVEYMLSNVKCDIQPELLNDAITAGFDAIVIATYGLSSVSGLLTDAISMGIKIIYVDTPADVPAEATFLTDNTAAGKTAGEQMRAALEGAGVTSGKIGIVNVNAITGSVMAREAGFREALADSGYEILETQYGEGDAAKSQSIAVNYVSQGVVGLFGANEGSAVGVGNAIKASYNSTIIGVGFDKSDAIMNLINDGWLNCTMAQNPDIMGYEGVKAAVAAVNGHSFGGEVFDTGVTVLKKSPS